MISSGADYLHIPEVKKPHQVSTILFTANCDLKYATVRSWKCSVLKRRFPTGGNGTWRQLWKSGQWNADKKCGVVLRKVCSTSIRIMKVASVTVFNPLTLAVVAFNCNKFHWHLECTSICSLQHSLVLIRHTFWMCLRGAVPYPTRWQNSLAYKSNGNKFQ